MLHAAMLRSGGRKGEGAPALRKEDKGRVRRALCKAAARKAPVSNTVQLCAGASPAPHEEERFMKNLK